MLELKPIELEDRKWIKRLLAASDFRGAFIPSAAILIWGKQYQILVGRFEDRYIACAGKKEPSFLFPAGQSALKPAVEAILRYCKDAGIPFRMHGILEESRAELDAFFPDRFVFAQDRDNYDYIYTSERLASLAGKKLHAKRNYVNQFLLGDWEFEEITPDNFAECLEMNAKWCQENGCSEDRNKQREVCAVRGRLTI